MLNQPTGFTPHEVMELHELIVGEITALQKMQAMMGVVHDCDLKGYIQNCTQTKQQRISAFQNLMDKAQNTTF
ncbi:MULTISPECIES: spore coat protein [Sporomusa]|uniref:spore coat protein n=1 Tax=Sporomusa TaxID=2375 RepID=UPI001666E2BE|nr:MULTISPECIES: spore coat protein [Sporomusa]MCM0759881.1 hypothetical protein [Sporomusa sphaeroides DSM 2875]